MNRTTPQTGEDPHAPNAPRAERPQAAPLELRSVTKRYPGADEDAIAELSLEVPAGDICVLVGPSIAKLGPDFAKVIAQVNTGLTTPVMEELNARVSLDKQTPAAVATAYLRESGYTK